MNGAPEELALLLVMKEGRMVKWPMDLSDRGKRKQEAFQVRTIAQTSNALFTVGSRD